VAGGRCEVSTGTCPICDNDDAREYEYHDEYMLVEHGLDCEVCGYTFSWAYGYTDVHVPGYDDFRFGYDWNEEEQAEEQAEIKRAKRAARLRWIAQDRRDKRGLIAKLRREIMRLSKQPHAPAST